MLDAQFQRRSWTDALSEVQRLRQAQPDSLRYRLFEISTLSNMGRYEDAAAAAKRYLAEHGESLAVLNVLKVSHFHLGKLDDAVRFGQRILELHDAETWPRPSPTPLPPSPLRART